MKHAIKVIAFDADDTLWSNEPFFQEVERKYTDLLSEYGSTEEISAELFKTEMGNLECLGYGAKAFTISMVETAVRVSGQKISEEKIQQIILLGKSLLQMPIELLPSVEETLKALKEQGIEAGIGTNSNILAAIGRSKAESAESVSFSLKAGTTMEDADKIVDSLKEIVTGERTVL